MNTYANFLDPGTHRIAQPVNDRLALDDAAWYPRYHVFVSPGDIIHVVVNNFRVTLTMSLD
jgi:hypothetical protein